MFDLPMTLDVGGVEHKINTDVRAVLDICTALSENISDIAKVYIAFYVFYDEEIPQDFWLEAFETMIWFIVWC